MTCQVQGHRHIWLKTAGGGWAKVVTVLTNGTTVPHCASGGLMSLCLEGHVAKSIVCLLWSDTCSGVMGRGVVVYMPSITHQNLGFGTSCGHGVIKCVPCSQGNPVRHPCEAASHGKSTLGSLHWNISRCKVACLGITWHHDVTCVTHLDIHAHATSLQSWPVASSYTVCWCHIEQELSATL
jgi:hypothetical protein